MCDWFFFFLFKQKTAYEMRISDWSSDVCSSDLHQLYVQPAERRGLVEHLRLDVAGTVPGRLAAGGGVECEDQPATPRRPGPWRHRTQPVEESVHLRAAGDLLSGPLDRHPVSSARHGGPSGGAIRTQLVT